MEELRTTEALDKEILEDARKKAYKILKTADDTLEAQNRDWKKKTEKAVTSIRKAYEEKLKKTGEEIFARLPLDKRRLRSETSEGFLGKAMRDFLCSLKRETLLAILEIELSKRLETGAGDLEGAKPDFLFSGMAPDEARKVLEGVMKGLNPKPDDLREGFPDSDVYALHEFPSIVIDTHDLKITVSVETAAAALLKDKRAELAAALLGEGVLND